MTSFNPADDPGLDVLRLDILGLTRQQVAARLHVHISVVSRRRSRYCKAIGAASPMQAVAIAGVNGWLLPADLRAALGGAAR